MFLAAIFPKKAIKKLTNLSPHQLDDLCIPFELKFPLKSDKNKQRDKRSGKSYQFPFIICDKFYKQTLS